MGLLPKTPLDVFNSLIDTASSLFKFWYEKEKNKPDETKLDIIKKYQEALRELETASNLPDDLYDDVTVNDNRLRVIELIQQFNKSITLSIPELPKL